MIYDMIARVYDEINRDVDYVPWADFIEDIIVRELGTAELVLDLGCGTGRMTVELAKRGYDMTGVDYSPEMLNQARERAEVERVADKVLWLCQDMRSFELYGTVDVTVSCLDCINHLTKPKDVRECFRLVHNYLNPDGIFIFDVNGRYKFENIYSDRSYVIEEENALCVWQNFYNPGTKLCDFYITLFEEREDGAYERYDEVQTERMYTLRSLRTMLTECGFEFVGSYGGLDMSVGDDSNERIYIVARCKK